MPAYTAQPALDALLEARDAVYRSDGPVVLATVVEAVGSNPQYVGARMLLLPNGSLRGTVGGGKIEARIVEDAKAMLASEESAQLVTHNLQAIGMTCGGKMSFFLERIEPAPRLMLFGGGHIAKPTAALAATTGFRVTVIDERTDWANPERFPTAEIINQPFPTFLESYAPEPHHFLVMVSQGHAHDKEILRHVLDGPQRYTGVIGSKLKANKLKKEIKAMGFSDELWDKVQCPMGIRIGSRTAEEIAVSIVAQLVQVRYADVPR